MRGVEPEPGRGGRGRVCWGAAGIVEIGGGDWVGEEVGEEVLFGEEEVREVEVGEEVEAVEEIEEDRNNEVEEVKVEEEGRVVAEIEVVEELVECVEG